MDWYIFVAQIFRRKWGNCFNSNFYFVFWNEYFDSDYGQSWFWDGILMEIIVNIGEIWWKLGGSVMVYIHWRTATNNLGNAQINTVFLAWGSP